MFLEILVEFILGTTLDEVWKHRKTVTEYIRQSTVKISRWQRSFVPKRSLIDREREIRAIVSAINETDSSRIILLIGNGGVGKTRILEEVIQQANKKRKRYIRYSGILDMYHPDLRNLLGLQDALVKNLDPKGQHFLTYRFHRERFEDRRYKGISVKALEDERNTMKQVFLEDYADFVKKYRSILMFDTAENLSPESDFIQSTFQIDNPQVAVRDWLLNDAHKLPNTTIVVASRPHSIPERSFLYDLIQGGTFSHGQIEALEMIGLTRIECQQFLAPWANNSNPVLQSLVGQADKLWELTQGYPVQLSLVIKLAEKTQSFIESATSTGHHPLKGEQLEPSILLETLMNSLFHYESDEPEQRIFYLLAIARRGLTAELLHYLEPTWTIEDCQQYLDNVRNDSLIKVRESTSTLFLHDALYELFDLYKRNNEQLDSWYHRLTSYYHGKQAYAANDRKNWGEAAVNILYYELHRNPRNAYEAFYLQWDDVTIRGREAEIEVQLRDEFLRFFNSPLNKQRLELQGLTTRVIEQESVIRWIKYYVDTSNYSRAIELAEAVISMIPQLSDITFSRTHDASFFRSLTNQQQQAIREIFQQVSPFFIAQLLAYYGDAQTFIGGDANWLESILDRAITLLKALRFNDDEPLGWLHKRLLGRTYNTLGYASQAYGHYGKALNCYKTALVHYTMVQGVDDERGNTLNNLAYLLAVLGDLETSQKYAGEALSIRQKLGQAYPIGLSYNTRGLIYALSKDLEWGIKECTLAFEEFEKIEDARGMGLVYNALGYIYRLKAEQAKRSAYILQRNMIEPYEQAEENLTLAVDIFLNEINEPVRLWEAYNELGSLYCDWGFLLQRCGEVQGAKERREDAIKQHWLALSVAKQHKLQFQQADTYDDLAEVATDQEDFEQAEVWLNDCLALIPEAYKDRTNLVDSQNSDGGEFYWLVLGKIHFQKGKWAFLRESDLDQGFMHFAQAIRCYREFWHTPYYLTSKIDSMSQYIKRASITSANAKEKLRQISTQLGVDLTMLLDAI